MCHNMSNYLVCNLSKSLFFFCFKLNVLNYAIPFVQIYFVNKQLSQIFIKGFYRVRISDSVKNASVSRELMT